MPSLSKELKVVNKTADKLPELNNFRTTNYSRIFLLTQPICADLHVLNGIVVINGDFVVDNDRDLVRQHYVCLAIVC